MTDPLNELSDDDPAPPELVPRAPRRHTLCSEAGYHFQLRHFQIFEFFFFGLKLSTHVDKAGLTAAEALAAGGNAEDVARLEKIKRDPEPAFRKLRSFGGYQSEVMIIRLVDNFMSFVSETLKSCMLNRTELLRSRDQIKIEDVLRFTDRAELIDFLINRKLNELSYGGLRGIEEFLDHRLNIALIENEDERTEMSVAIELRNIYTHSRGIVNELFLSRISTRDHKYKFTKGIQFHSNFDQLIGLSSNIFDIAIRLDSQVLEKFNLQKKSFIDWDSPRLAQLNTHNGER